MEFVVLREYGFDALGCDDVDGPFVLPGGKLGLLLSLRGKQGGALEEALSLPAPHAPCESRLAALRVFASRWFGARADAPERSLDGIARPLRVLHGLVDAPAVCTQDRFVPADELRAEGDGHLVFLVENQGHHDALDPRALSKLAKRIPPLPLPAWRSSDERFYGGEGVVGFAIPNGPDFTVYLGAKDRVAIDALGDLLAAWPGR